MSIQASLSPTFAPSGATQPVVERRCAEYHPTVWGYHFLINNSEPVIMTEREKKRMDELTLEVKMMLTDADDDCHRGKLLNLIDHIQRLGIGYLFEGEIDGSLEQIFNRCSTSWDCGDSDHDLHITALVFRLLRQHGYRISCNVFDKFVESGGKFSQSLAKDVRGLLSLYEASHFGVRGEDILDDALTFTVNHLKMVVENDDPKLSPSLVAEVKYALERCLRRGMARLHAWHYIQIYGEDASHNEVLLELAKLDFNWLQKLHQKELCEITRWWRDQVDVKKNFPYARNRVVECYFWMLAVTFEPEFSLSRMILTKVISLISILDDTYDGCGTVEELQLLTDAIDRWDMSSIGELPEYMQILYKVLLDTYNGFEKKLAEKGSTRHIFYAKEAMKNQARVYMKEAKWFHEGYIPTLEEYMPLATETIGCRLLAVASFVGMGDVASEDAFEWLNSDPKILRALLTVSRLMNDVASHKFEQKRGHVASAVECYMKQYAITEQEAEKELRKMIDDKWKDINEECLRPTPAAMPLLTRLVNLTRTADVLYKDVDIYTQSQTDMKNYVATLLVNPIPI